eukprot:8894248-Pyramimonas_sp.AAC.1
MHQSQKGRGFLHTCCMRWAAMAGAQVMAYTSDPTMAATCYKHGPIRRRNSARIGVGVLTDTDVGV